MAQQNQLLEYMERRGPKYGPKDPITLGSQKIPTNPFIIGGSNTQSSVSQTGGSGLNNVGLTSPVTGLPTPTTNNLINAPLTPQIGQTQGQTTQQNKIPQGGNQIGGTLQQRQIKTPKMNIPTISSPEGYRQAGEQKILQEGMMEQNKIMQQYQDTIGTLKFQEAQVEGKFSNADLVTQNIQSVMDQFKQGVMDPLQISRNTGLSIDRVNNIIRGKGFDELQLSPRYEQEVSKPVNQALGDLETNKQRELQDYEISKQRLQVTTQRTMDDMLGQMQKSQYATSLAGGLAGASGSSGFEFGIQSIKGDFDKMTKRLTEDVVFQDSQMTLAKTRMMENYANQVTKINDSFQRSLADMKMQAGMGLFDIQNKYGLATEETSNALQRLYASIESQQMNIYNQTLGQMKTLHDISMDEYAMIQKAQQERYMNVGGGKVFDTTTGQMVSQQGNQTTQNIAQTTQQYAKQLYDTDAKKQCGTFVNDIIQQTTGTRGGFGDSLQSKKDLINSDAPVLGAVVVMTSTKFPNAGHVGIVTGINEDGTIQITDANWNGDQRVGSRTLTPQQMKNMVLGYHVPGGQRGGGTISAEANEARKSGKILGTESQKTKIRKELTEAGYFDLGKGNSVFFNLNPSMQGEIRQVTQAKMAVDEINSLVKELSNDPDFDFAGEVGSIDEFINKAYSTMGISLKSDPIKAEKLQRLRNLVDVELVMKMKEISGAAISEPERERLLKTFPNMSMGIKEFESSLKNYTNSMNRQIDSYLNDYGFDSIDSIINRNSNTTQQNRQEAQQQPSPYIPELPSFFTPAF